MSNRDGFTSGLLTGALLGGLVGGLIGAALGSRSAQKAASDEPRLRDRPRSTMRKKPRILGADEDMEAARQILEVKISQLNDAIDEVREQLHSVNGSMPAIDDEKSVIS
jgi:hypothetical protein